MCNNYEELGIYHFEISLLMIVDVLFILLQFLIEPVTPSQVYYAVFKLDDTLLGTSADSSHIMQGS